MGWFGLDPASIVDRVKASGAPVDPPTLAGSAIRGAVGFTVVSVAGFSPWALAGKRLPELAMYGACAAVFIGLSGLLLHRLIIGPGSMGRFYTLFGAAFAVNSVLWIASWMLLKGHLGSLVGLLAGTAAMGGMFAAAFEERRAALPSIVALFVLNTAGYYVGGWGEAALARANLTVAMLLWGVFYGLGLGSGLGLAFHFCQKTVRERLAKP
jgi:hypothetical protein